MDIEGNSQAASEFAEFTLVVEAFEGIQFLPETPMLRYPFSNAGPWQRTRFPAWTWSFPWMGGSYPRTVLLNVVRRPPNEPASRRTYR